MKNFLKKIFPENKYEKVNMTPAEEKSFKRLGFRIVLGGVFTHFVLGTFYIWGGISTYVASYLKSYNDAVDIDLVKLVFPLMFLGINAMMSPGVKLAEKYGHRKVCIVGISCVSAAGLIVSYVTNYIIFIIIYCVMVGLASGLVYMVPVVCGWKFFPTRKGIVSGVVLAGYGFGSLAFNLIALNLVNPNNHPASVIIDGHKYFPEEIYSKVPRMFRILALLYLIIGSIGCILVTTPKRLPLPKTEPQPEILKPIEATEAQQLQTQIQVQDQAQVQVIVSLPPKQQIQDCQSISEGIKTFSFWVILFMMFFGCLFGFLMANNYKVYGQTSINDDSFLTLVGSLGSASNGCSRIIWAALYDRFGFRKVYFFIMSFQVVAAATLHQISDVKPLYLIWHVVIMATEGGQFAVMPPVATKIYGPKIGPIIFGILYIGFSAANLGAFFLVKFTLEPIGWGAIFWICFGLSVAAWVGNFLVNEKNKVGKRITISEQVEMAKLPLPEIGTQELEATNQKDDSEKQKDEESTP